MGSHRGIIGVNCVGVSFFCEMCVCVWHHRVVIKSGSQLFVGFAHRNIKFTHSRQSRPFGQNMSTTKIDQLLESSGQVCRILMFRKYIIVLMDDLLKVMVDKRDVFIVSVA